MTFGKMLARFLRNMAALLIALGQKAKPFENRSVSVAQSIFDQEIRITISALQVVIKAFRDMLNAAAN